MIVADTDVLIDYVVGAQPMADLVAEYRRSDNLQTTAITCFELLSGARGRLAEKAHSLASTIPVLPLNRDSATRAASVRQELERLGLSVGMADSLIAGIALANDSPLLTRNRKHFERIEGLSLVDF